MGKLTGFKEYTRKTADKRAVDERKNDYNEIYISLTEDVLKEQGARCMSCGTPFCNWGCPVGNLMPDWNDMVYNGQWEKAFKRLSMTNNFPEITGRICPALCEGACTLGVNRQPVAIRELELSIIEKAFKEGWIKPNIPKVRTGKKVAVIGSGPAGLAAAAQLNSVGHYVIVFERADAIGGLLRYGIPDFKLEKNILDRRIDIMKTEGIEFKVNTYVGVDYPSDVLLKDFDAVVLAGGSTIPRDITVEGRDLKGIHFAVDYLTEQNKRVAGKQIHGEQINAKDKVVLVIGGGDTGSDCIGTAVRQGAKKVYQYEILPKAPIERDDTMPWPEYPRTYKVTTSHEEGCERDFCISTKKFEGKDGVVSALHAVRVEWIKDDKGRMNMVEQVGTEFEQPVDLVLLAMGFMHPEQSSVLKELGIKLDGRGNVAIDKDMMTNVKGVFSAGDMRKGQSLVVWAIDDGRSVAKAVDKYLMGETIL